MSSRGLSNVPTRDLKYVKSELEQIGAKIRAKRKSMKMTQEALAEQIEVTPETIRFIEQNRRIPSLPMLIRIARALKLDILK